MSNPENLPELPPDMKAAFDDEMARYDQGEPPVFGEEVPGLGRMTRVNPNDMTQRQKNLLSLMGRKLREHREAKERGEEPPTGFF